MNMKTTLESLPLPLDYQAGEKPLAEPEGAGGVAGLGASSDSSES